MNYRFDTLAIHAGYKPDAETGAVMPPIHLSSTFAQKGPGGHLGFEYSRSDNPTRRILEHNIAALEGANYGMAFSSGCAAVTTLFSTLRPGDHVVAGDDLYGGSSRILQQVVGPMGILTDFVDLTDPQRVLEAIRPTTRWIWFETPTNPTLKLVDIEAVAKIAKSRSVFVGVDNTFATPVLQKPLSLGADVVVHSSTKYLNGHSDVVGGVLLTSHDKLAERVRFLQNAMGGVPSPFDCFLVLRGIKTLPVRVREHVRNAEQLAAWLETQPCIEKVIYPGLPSHPQAALAKKQMASGGGMLSFVLKGGIAASRKLLESVRLFVCAESLGGVESLIELPALMTHARLTQEDRNKLGITDGLIRVSVGLEAVEDLQYDLEQALKKTI